MSLLTWPDGGKVSVKRCSKLWHVGALRIEQKGLAGPSQEGNGLSVSLHPAEWTAIAKLGSNPTWELVRPGAQFLQFHALTQSRRLALQQWGVEQGYVEQRVQWELSWHDEEEGRRLKMLLPTQQDAEAERCERAGEIHQVKAACPTDAVTHRLGFKTDILNALDIIATFWVEDTTDLDGVWWQDTLDPWNYSAPRGVIVPRALSSWTASRRLDDRIAVHQFPAPAARETDTASEPAPRP